MADVTYDPVSTARNTVLASYGRAGSMRSSSGTSPLMGHIPGDAGNVRAGQEALDAVGNGSGPRPNAT